MFLKQIFDPALAQYAYLIGCQRTGEALIIDPERDIDTYQKIAEDNDLKITSVAETHIHADFVSGSREFLETQGGVTAYLSDMGPEDWKYEWAKGRTDVQLVHDGDTFRVGNIEITVIHTPGHTPEHICFLIEDQGGGADEPMGLATGDFVFVGDVGRPDLLESAAGVTGAMEPSARTLYHSLRKFGELPDYLQVLPAHGAGSACGKALGAVPVSTVGYEKRFNSPLRTALHGSENEFVQEILTGQPEPPMYFANMKKVNKLGPAVLGGIPRPARLEPADLVPLINQPNNVFLDTRTDQVAFMQEHLVGSLFTPKGNKLSTVAGSFVTPELDIYLLLNHEFEAERVVRELIRIGLDNIKGYALIESVRRCAECRPHLVATEMIRTSDIHTTQKNHPEAVVLDVRRATEFAEHSVPGSVNMAYTRLASNLEHLPKTKLIVHCQSGKRAAFSTAYLERMGVDVIFADGDYEDWKRIHTGPERHLAGVTLVRASDMNGFDILTIAYGIIIGISLGMTGGGGSIFAVPLLIYGLHSDVRVAIGISLAAVGATALFGGLIQLRNGQVEFKTALVFAVAGMLGAPVGTWIGARLPDVFTLTVFALIMLYAGIRMWREKAREARPNATCARNIEGELRLSCRCFAFLSGAGLLVGILSGIFGVGGGFIIVPALIFVTGMSIHRAVSSSLLVIALICLSGVASYVWRGDSFPVKLSLMFITGGLLGMIGGGRLRTHCSPSVLRRVFALSMWFVGLFVLSQNLIFPQFKIEKKTAASLSTNSKIMLNED